MPKSNFAGFLFFYSLCSVMVVNWFDDVNLSFVLGSWCLKANCATFSLFIWFFILLYMCQLIDNPIFLQKCSNANCAGSPLLTWIIVFLVWLFDDVTTSFLRGLLKAICASSSLLVLLILLLLSDDVTLIFVLWCPNCARSLCESYHIFAFICVHWLLMWCSILCVLLKFKPIAILK